MNKSHYIATILLISIIFLFSSRSTFAEENGLVPLTPTDVNSPGPVTPVTVDNYRNGSDLQSDNSVRPTATPLATPSGSNNNASTDADNILGIEAGKLRQGDVDMSTIPILIVNVISTLLAIAGTVAIFSLIYHAVQMQINSGITGDSSGVDKAKKGMIGALVGFVIAISGWFLVTRAVDLLSAVS